MSNDLSKEQFIQRLIDAGWPPAEAEAEWDNIQNDTEGEL